MIIFLCVACNDEELMYSCDPEVNNWVLENKDKYANISRDELARFNRDEQLGLFRSFSPDQKMYLYKEKYSFCDESINCKKTDGGCGAFRKYGL